MSKQPAIRFGVHSVRPPAIALMAVLALAAGLPATAPASAADLDLYVDDIGSKRYVKLGLGKSMVVRLPRAARDVLVSDPEKVDAITRTSRKTYLIGKKVGQTNAFFFDSEGREILNLEIQVERDLAILKRMLRKIIPGNGIRLESVNDNVILTGTVSSASQSKRASDLAAKFAGKPEQVLNMLSIAGKEQVALKVSVVEMQRTVLKQLGIDLATRFDISRTVVNLATVNPFTLGLPGGLGAAAAYSKGGTIVSSTLRAMERNGLLRTLAEPTLTAVSGEPAKFLAGGEFPVPVAGDKDTVTVEYKPFGVGLGFTPVVLSEGRISLKVSTEVSELSTDNAFQLRPSSSTASLTIPSLVTRRAETVVEMPSGGSLVMAGLIKDRAKQQLNGVPGVKDVPILGALFRSRDFSRAETELVVIVTPYVVKPVAGNKLTRPDQGLNFPRDAKAVLFGRLNKVYGASGRPLPEGAYHGSYGFIVE